MQHVDIEVLIPARECRFESCLRHQLETAPQVCWFRSAFTVRTFRVFQAVYDPEQTPLGLISHFPSTGAMRLSAASQFSTTMSSVVGGVSTGSAASGGWGSSFIMRKRSPSGEMS